MTEISLIEVYRIVDSFFKYFEGNFLVEHFARNYYGKRGFKRMGMSQKFVTFSPSPTSFKLSFRTVSRLLINILFYYRLLLRRVCSVRTGDSAEYDDVGNRAGSDAVIAVNAAGHFAGRI